MTKLDRLFRNSLKLNEVKVLIEVYKDKEVQRFIIELNRTEQLFKKGVNIEGKIIGTYSPFTEMLHPEKKAGTPYNFDLTGVFRKSFRFKLFRDGSFVIVANDVKEQTRLTEKYPGLLGVTVKSTNELVKKILPFVIGETRKALFKGIS